MAAKPILVASKQYDEAKLLAMTEPLHVRVEKMRNGTRMAIPLPQSEDAPDQPGGAGYDKEAVRGLEQFLVTSWSGGGTYVIKVTDANGQAFEWMTSFPVAEFPEITPPPLQGAATPFVQPAPTRRTPQMPAFPQGFPQMQSLYPQAQQPQQAYYGQPQGYPYPLPPPPPFGSPAYPMWREEAKERTESAELKALREENARRDREMMQARHQAELERERVANEQRFAKQDQALAALQAMISNLATTITNKPTTTADPALEALKLQIEQQKQLAEQAAREREADKRDRDQRDLIKSMTESSERQFQAMQRQLEAFQASLTAINANKQDPMIEMLREQARQSAEGQREISRNFTAVIEKMQSSSLSPRDIIALTQDSSKNAEQITDKLATTYGRVIDMQQKVTENALQMQPQGSPVVDMIREGIGNAQSMVERYFGRAELQAKLEATKHEQLVAAQRDITIAQLGGQPQAQAGLNGHAEAQPSFPPSSPAPKRGKKAATAASAKPPRKINGHTDAEWFGPMEDNIVQLRASADKFVENLKAGKINDENIDNYGEVGASPARAAEAIFMGVNMAVQTQVNILALDALLMPQMFGDFLDVVLPDAPEQYRVDVLNVLIPALRGEVGGSQSISGIDDDRQDGSEAPDDVIDAEAEEMDEDEETDEQTTDDDHDGAPAPARGLSVVPAPAPTPTPTKPNGKPVHPRRA